MSSNHQTYAHSGPGTEIKVLAENQWSFYDCQSQDVHQQGLVIKTKLGSASYI